ncbi:VWA domain-containing protein [Sphaerisporangium siamense]|uniref:vWA domain-containing protein n=1 Tax=Sphaerisporangium siamense TaxID=795645 RepID=UPI001A4BD90B|nr:VWA domain-containing protein [Sphaerisporangium siamense]GII88687.1 VWA domain-containing protein [Sphaerisporangium siamense]
MVGFARTLRAAGVPADHERTQAMLEAAVHLGAADREAVYWAGRLTMCAGPDDLPRYDRCFAAYFGGDRPGPGRPAPVVTVVRHTLAPDGDGSSGDASREALAATAGRTEVLRHRDVARMTPAELAEVHRMIGLLRARREPRRSRRFAPSTRGRLDPRRTMRETLRRGGEIARLRRRSRRVRPRRVVLLVDVSGSMAPYADTLLRFAHALVRCEPRATEVFSVGTRLTRVTPALRHRDPGAAMREVSAAVPDWRGGTRLGEELKRFLDSGSTARGAIVVIASDGWERGDPSLLGRQMARLSRLAHRVVWANPHKGHEGYEPLTGGMRAALPYVGAFVAGHSLAAFEELAERLSHA